MTAKNRSGGILGAAAFGVLLLVALALVPTEYPKSPDLPGPVEVSATPPPATAPDAVDAPPAPPEMPNRPERTRKRVNLARHGDEIDGAAAEPLSDLPLLPEISQELDGADILAHYLAGKLDPTGLVVRPDEMRARIRTGQGDVHRIDERDGRVVDLAPFAGAETVLEFGTGTFVLEWGAWHDYTRDIRSLEIRGAGMDRTTLVGPKPHIFYVADDRVIRHIAVRDLTLDGDGGGPRFDVRGSAALALDRVRFQNWDKTGYCAPIGASGAAFVVARDCEFVGSGAEHDYGLALRGDALVSLLGCRFRNLRRAITGGGGDPRPAVVAVLDSTFVRTRLARSGILRDDGTGVSILVRGGRVTIGSIRDDEAELRRLWRADAATSIERTRFRPPRR